MFKLPNKVPSLRTSAQDWADYAEYQALKKGSISFYELIKTPMMITDDESPIGIEDSTDKYINKIDEITSEINWRKSILGESYPFTLTNNDYCLKYISSDSLHNCLYRFLLLSTRLNMKDDRRQQDIDGALLFEHIAALVALSFFGEKSEVDVLGTSKSNVGGFREKLVHITRKMGEGGTIHTNEGFQPQDDNIDVIVWKGFSDKQPSQMIAFGQCKTGTSWQDRLSELNTDAFCKTWFTRQPVITPLRMFFCSQYFPKEIWYPRVYEAGLVFDRFRILDYFPAEVPKKLYNDLLVWSNSAQQMYAHLA